MGRGISIHVDVQKKHVWFLSGLIVLLLGFGIVAAFGGVVPDEMGHSLGEIEFPVCADGQILEYSGGGLVCGNDVAGAKVTSGTYFGDRTVNRPIAHGLGVTPKLVVITGQGGTLYRIHDSTATIFRVNAGYDDAMAVQALSSTNFYVGFPGEYARAANTNANYYWTAFG